MTSSRRSLTSESCADRVRRWLDDIRMVSDERHALVQALRLAVLALGAEGRPKVTEEVKYGGLLFSAAEQAFCGVFSYTGHVSLELGEGAALADPAGVLEGTGKARRHIKLRHIDDIARCQVAAYLREAFLLKQSGDR